MTLCYNGRVVFLGEIRMIKKNFRLIFVAFIMISIFVVTGFMIINLRQRGKTSSSDSQDDDVVIEGTSSGYDNNTSKVKDLEFYVSESSIRKTKTYPQETTMLSLSAKIYITNYDSKIATINVDEIGVEYDTNGGCKLFEIDYGEIENPVNIVSNETIAINVVVKYIIVDDNFNDNIKRELKFNYKDKQIFVCQV